MVYIRVNTSPSFRKLPNRDVVVGATVRVVCEMATSHNH